MTVDDLMHRFELCLLPVGPDYATWQAAARRGAALDAPQPLVRHEG